MPTSRLPLAPLPPELASGLGAERLQAFQQALLAEQLPADALQALTAHGQWQALPAHTSVAHALSAQQVCLLTVGAGWLRHYGRQGADLVVAEVSVGLWWGGPGMAAAATQAVRLHVPTPSTLVSWDIDALGALWQRYPSLQCSYARSAAQMAGAALRRLIELGTLTVRGRLQARLRVLADAAGVANNQAWLAHPPTQAALAALLGCSREEVSREMSSMARAGWLLRQGRGWRVLNVAALCTEWERC